MLHYINLMNRPIIEEKIPDHRLRQDLKAFAWECLRNWLAPSAAKISRLQQALGGDDADRRLAYLDARLSLAMVIDPPGDEMRLRLDPLAEMLAALYLCDTGATEPDRADWFALFDKIRGLRREGATHAGFVGALREVTSTCGARHCLPPFIGEYVSFLADSLALVAAVPAPKPEDGVLPEDRLFATSEAQEPGDQMGDREQPFKLLRPGWPRHALPLIEVDRQPIMPHPVDQPAFAGPVGEQARKEPAKTDPPARL
jgi:hypothetical protein